MLNQMSTHGAMTNQKRQLQVLPIEVCHHVFSSKSNVNMSGLRQISSDSFIRGLGGTALAGAVGWWDESLACMVVEQL